MLPGLRFFAATMFIGLCLLSFGLGAAALLRATRHTGHTELSDLSLTRLRERLPVSNEDPPALPKAALLRINRDFDAMWPELAGSIPSTDTPDWVRSPGRHVAATSSDKNAGAPSAMEAGRVEMRRPEDALTPPPLDPPSLTDSALIAPADRDAASVAPSDRSSAAGPAVDNPSSVAVPPPTEVKKKRNRKHRVRRTARRAKPVAVQREEPTQDPLKQLFGGV